MRLVNIDRLKAEGFITAEEAAAVGPGTPIRLRVTDPSASQKEHEGAVVFVSPEVDPITNQVRIWAEVDNRQGLLRPGQPVGMVLVAKTPADDLAKRPATRAE
jgi:macrolide-specific efflux system membrane fusion protein